MNWLRRLFQSRRGSRDVVGPTGSPQRSVIGHQGEPPPGLATAERSSTIPGEAYRLNDEGERFHARGQYDRAIELLSEAVRLAPDYADAYNNLAVVHAARGDYPKAISFSEKALSMNPANGTYHSTLALTYYKMDNLDQAISAFKKAISLGDTKAENYSVLGSAYLKSNLLDEAIAAYKRALELNPSLTGSRNNLRSAESLKQQSTEADVMEKVETPPTPGQRGYCQMCGKPEIPFQVMANRAFFLCSKDCEDQYGHLRAEAIRLKQVSFTIDTTGTGLGDRIRTERQRAYDSNSHCWFCGKSKKMGDDFCSSCGRQADVPMTS